MMLDLKAHVMKKQMPIHVGDRVRLNLKTIRSQKEYPKNLFPQYVDWINANGKKMFTVTRNQNGICNLERDGEEIPWTFWEGHLQFIRREE